MHAFSTSPTTSPSPHHPHHLILPTSPSPPHPHHLTLTTSSSPPHPPNLTLTTSPSPPHPHHLILTTSPSPPHPLHLTLHTSPSPHHPPHLTLTTSPLTLNLLPTLTSTSFLEWPVGGEEPEVTGVEVAEPSGNSCLMKASLLTATICSKLTCSASLFFSRKPDCRREGKSQGTCQSCTCMCMYMYMYMHVCMHSQLRSRRHQQSA